MRNQENITNSNMMTFITMEKQQVMCLSQSQNMKNLYSKKLNLRKEISIKQ